MSYQKDLAAKLITRLPMVGEIKTEWYSFKGFKVHYSPKVDVAMSPFSIEKGETKTKEHNDLLKNDIVNNFLRELYKSHVNNVRSLIAENALAVNEVVIPSFKDVTRINSNARCFLAIEIENKNSKKHVLGSIINASALGRIGIGIARSKTALKTFIREVNYLAFIKRAKNMGYETRNFLIVTDEQMATAIKNIPGI